MKENGREMCFGMLTPCITRCLFLQLLEWIAAVDTRLPKPPLVHASAQAGQNPIHRKCIPANLKSKGSNKKIPLNFFLLLAHRLCIMLQIQWKLSWLDFFYHGKMDREVAYHEFGNDHQCHCSTKLSAKNVHKPIFLNMLHHSRKTIQKNNKILL